ncbi:MAG: FtsB family cell division protein [Chitinophagales bacterium]
MQRIIELYQKIPTYLRTKYALTALLFLLWMTLIDTNTISSHFRLQDKLDEMYAQKTYYIEEIEHINIALEDLLNNESSLEKFARENFYMKKKNEDVFVVIEK